MIRGYSAIAQAFLGTLFTWGLTGAGAALVFCFSSKQHKILNGSLGFAAGVMIAASYWSLLKPAIEIAVESERYGANGEFVFIPVGVGFLLGAVFVCLTDIYLPCYETSNKLLFPQKLVNDLKKNGLHFEKNDPDSYTCDMSFPALIDKDSVNSLRRRQRAIDEPENFQLDPATQNLLDVRWRRMLLMIIAITVHNIPEGLAVGVGFGAVDKTKSATFESARNLALGIGMQNFPEGLAVSLPLHGAGMSKWKSFWFGQLSGLVEPVSGLLGCVAITLVEPLLPYALAFAAGAMIYVVVDDIIPEARINSNGKLASWLTIVGFIVMMSLDVGLG